MKRFLHWLRNFKLPPHQRGFKPSANYHELKTNFIKKEFTALENDHFSKWCFMKNFPLRVSKLDGKIINYAGCGFDGNPEKVFWSQDYVPAYIKSFCFEGCRIAKENSKRLDLNPNRCLTEFKRLLFPEISQAYRRMAGISARLLGNGIQIPQERDTSRNVIGGNAPIF